MRTTASNWILSLLITIIICAYYYLNIFEVENYRDKTIEHYNNLIVNSLNNYLEQTFNSQVTKTDNNQFKLDSTSKHNLKNILSSYLSTPELHYLIIQSKTEKIIINPSNNIIETKIPEISNDKMFIIYQNSKPQVSELEINDKDIYEIQSPLQLELTEPVILRIGLDLSHLSAPYRNYLINSLIITFMLLIVIILFINYQDVLKVPVLISDNQLIINIFSKISENSTNGLIFIDVQNRIRIFNQVASDITGIDKTTALMNDYFEVFPNDYFNVDEVFSSKKSIGLTNIKLITDKDIHRDIYFSTMFLIIDDVFTGILISMQDVTDFNKNIHLKINKTVLEANSKLASGITAAFLNKINRIYLSFQAILNKKDITQDIIKKHSDLVLADVLEVENLLKKFVDLTKIEKVNYSQVSVNDIIEKIIDSCKFEAKNKQIQVQKNYRMFLTFYCDEKLLEEIISILYRNAIEAIQMKGDIIISAEQTMATTTIKITDSGFGIDKQIQEKLFYPYNTTKPNHLGFGLATVKKYIILLNGEISYLTTEGLGTTFSITLPNRYDLKGQV